MSRSILNFLFASCCSLGGIGSPGVDLLLSERLSRRSFPASRSERYCMWILHSVIIQRYRCVSRAIRRSVDPPVKQVLHGPSRHQHMTTWNHLTSSQQSLTNVQPQRLGTAPRYPATLQQRQPFTIIHKRPSAHYAPRLHTNSITFTTHPADNSDARYQFPRNQRILLHLPHTKKLRIKTRKNYASNRLAAGTPLPGWPA